MRDANWSPDWPTSAKQVEWFYNTEYNLLPEKDKIGQFGGNLDGVIAVTPQFVSDLLNIVGPISIGSETFSSQNFQDLLQYEVEQGYVGENISSWDRKGIVGQLLEELKIKLFDLPSLKWQDVFNTINNDLNQKNILLYFNNPRLEDYAKYLKWDGATVYTPKDYLHVVDANLGSFKTDAVVNKTIDYSLVQKDNGLFATLDLSYSHTGGFDWRTTTYRTYTRVYVPEGSSLVSVEGVGSGTVDVGKELGKTYFGMFIEVSPGTTKKISIKYKLPNSVNELVKHSRNYNLYVEKQPGSRIQELKVDFRSINKVKSYNPIGFNVSNIGQQEIAWTTGLETDKAFNVSF